MNSHNDVPIGVLHILQSNVSQDTCVVNKHIDPAEVFDGSLDDLIALLNGIVICYGLATSVDDLFDDLVGCLYIVRAVLNDKRWRERYP